MVWLCATEYQGFSDVGPHHGIKEQLEGCRGAQDGLHGIVVRESEAVVALADKRSNNIVGKVGDKRGMCNILESFLLRKVLAPQFLPQANWLLTENSC